jgi:penicillin-binding protein 1A
MPPPCASVCESAWTSQSTAPVRITSPLRNTNAFLRSSGPPSGITLAYTVFANGGSRPSSLIIEKMANAEGKQIFKAEPQTVKAISREAAWQVTEGLEAALRTGAASIAFAELGLKDMPVAGKTGTAYNFTDTYFFGYSSGVTCGVWVGFDRPTRIYRGAFGKDLALPIWTKIMNIASEEFPPVKFDKPAPESCRDLPALRVVSNTKMQPRSKH